jgi:hypothetical protein
MFYVDKTPSRASRLPALIRLAALALLAISLSSPASAQTAPSAPTLLTATPAYGQVTLTWSAPASIGSSSLSGYWLQAYLNGSYVAQTKVGPSVLSGTIVGLTAQAYTFTVKAYSTSATSPASKVLGATPRVPTTPSAPTLSGTPANGSVNLAWNAGSNGGSTITNYMITATQNGAQVGTQNVPTNGQNVTSWTGAYSGLTNGQAYAFTIQAQNAVGTGAVSNAVTVTPNVPSPPGPPTGVAIVQSPDLGANRYTVSWSAPASNGGAPITQYSIRISLNGTYVTAQATTLLWTPVTLSSSGKYSIVVAATNSAGTSAYSSPIALAK